jgi:transposase
MDSILEVYKIERAALDADLLGTDEHLEMRQTASKAVMDDFRAWLDDEQPLYPPRNLSARRSATPSASGTR